MALTLLEIFGVLVGVFLLSVLLVFVAIKIYFQTTCGKCVSQVKMTGKTVIITGANSGIGKETARDMARRGARVILACRNLEAATTVKDELIKETGNPSIVVMKLDLSNEESIRMFAANVIECETRLDVLIHNAGVAYLFKKVTTADGRDMTMMTNYFGPFLLTHLLIDLMKQSAPARIVVVSSLLHYLCSWTFKPSMLTRVRYWCPGYLYNYSKYAGILFTFELARRLQGTGVIVNCLHPGVIETNIWRNMPFPISTFLLVLRKGLFKTASEGAETTIHCAVCEQVCNVSGQYFADCKPGNCASGLHDEQLAKKIWSLTESVILRPTDPVILPKTQNTFVKVL